METKPVMKMRWWIAFLLSLAATIPAQAQNPLPFISQPLVPTAAPPGGPEFTLTVNGTGFVSGSVVMWNGIALSTKLVNSGQLTATVPDGHIASAGTASVTVVTPVGKSNVVYFEITNPVQAVSFQTPTLAGGGSSIAVADFNGDGKLDLALADSGGSSLVVRLGNGDGTFQTAVKYAVNKSPTSVAVGDFNGDGTLDLAVSSIENDNVAIFLGSGDGTFQYTANYKVGAEPFSIAVGDFNRDGKLDLSVANLSGGSVTVLLGNGDGTFYPAGPDLPVGFHTSSIAVGDFNGDGTVDMVVSNANNNNVSILLGNGNGTFQPPLNYSAGLGAVAVSVGDFNGDGFLDLAVANEVASTVSVLLGNGDGTFQKAVAYPVGKTPQSVAVGDLNGDGILDLVVADNGSSSVSVLLGNGDGTFQPASNYDAGLGPSFVALGDFDGDGTMDLAVGSILLQAPPTPIAFPQLTGGNNFTGNQTINGIVTATSFVGDGSGLSGVNAASATTATNALNLGGVGASIYARLDLPNIFSTSQNVIGSVTATSFFGNGTGLIGVNATTAGNASNLGGVTAANYARLDIDNNLTGNQTIAKNLDVAGNSTTVGTVTIGNAGTPISKHISVLFTNVAFNTKMTPGTCVVWSGPISSAADGDTVAASLSGSLMSANIVFSSWAGAGTISVRICNPTAAPTTVGSGTIRVDLWKH